MRRMSPWKYYTGSYFDLVNPAVNIYEAFRKIRYGAGLASQPHYSVGNDLMNDISNCRLAQVSFVMPNRLDSDHAGSLSATGPGWVGSIYLALVRSSKRAAGVRLLSATAR